MLKSGICCGCHRIASTSNGHFLCSDSLSNYGCAPDQGGVDIARNAVRSVLWQIFNQSIINEQVNFPQHTFNDPYIGITSPVFDFEIPEYRLLIDVVISRQFGNEYMYDEKTMPEWAITKSNYEHSKNKFADDNNYRRKVILVSTVCDTSLSEIRTSILESLNEVYVLDTPGKVQVLTPRLQGDIGWDLVCDETVVCQPNAGVDVPTQVFLEMPNHLYAIVQARSSTSKRKLIVLPGVIDPSYRGQIFTMVFNPTSEQAIIKKGDRISQLLFFHRIPHIQLNPVNKLMPSERGANGFGSTS